jgi:hypothetical protein
MTITLTPRQTKWLEEQVAAGAFPEVLIVRVLRHSRNITVDVSNQGRP